MRKYYIGAKIELDDGTYHWISTEPEPGQTVEEFMQQAKHILDYWADEVMEQPNP